ncbi:carbohydrate ABC transporter permease [Chloroflexota bacterium]
MMSRLKLGGHYLAGLLVTVIFILPLFWALVASLRQPDLPPPPSIEWWPQTPHWHNYLEIFHQVPMVRYTLNSLLVVAVAVPVTVVTASLAGFAIEQLPDRQRRQWVTFSIALLMIPNASVWLFRFQIFRWLGLLDTLWALIAPAFAASSPLFVLLFYWTFRRIPAEIYQAARLDGANAVKIWWKLALPLTRPTVAGVAVLTFVMYWSDFVSPVLYIFQPQRYTLPIGLQILKQLGPTNWSLLMAAAVFMTVPVVLLFVFLQSFFLHDMSLANLLDKD